MKDAQKPDHISLNALIDRLKDGHYVIPDFQREFEWKPWDIRDLMRSIFLDYYIGSLLLWEGKKKNFEALSCEAVYGFAGTCGEMPWTHMEKTPKAIVLDGQQRLTAMNYAFTAPDVPLPGRANRAFYFIQVEKFMAQEYDEAFLYEWTSKQINKLIAIETLQFEQHMFPLGILGAGRYDLPNWLQGYSGFWKKAYGMAKNDGDERKARDANLYFQNAEKFGEYVTDIAEKYQVAYIELDEELPVDKVCDIFTQVNSKGVRLDVFDLINALLKPKGLQLKRMWRQAQPRLEFPESAKMNVYALQVMSILLQSYCSPKYLYYLLPGQEKQIRSSDGQFATEILIPDAPTFQANWDAAVSALEKAIVMLRDPREFGAISAQYLPYVSILPVFSALQTACSKLPASKRLDAQRKIRHWYWASVFVNRYSGSVESTSARDFLDVKAWIADDDVEPPVIEEFKERSRNLDLRKEIRKGSSVYNGIFNLLILKGARDWMTGNAPQHGELDDHHIVPVAKAQGALADINVHTILNRTPLTAETNRHAIRDRLPNQYLPELIANSSEGQVRSVLESHFISPAALEILQREPFEADDFEAFIAERHRTILEAIEDLLIKERLDLSPTLREMDQQIEETELNLRKLVADSLGGDPSHLPQHVLQKLNERIHKAAKKNAAIDMDNFKDLNSKLQFADLHELQDAITSKVTWSQFQETFANKETVIAKFNQLCELRNGIRHSRTVDEITSKEGEAAILWFEKVMVK